ncbi:MULTISPECIES: hypothetical protein [unclassified Cytobacillus]|uniref:hypothetical protein n=1 Tax=unclassified Cytobacillus TaxID=2675268 RepID=UPI00203BD291|nr:hypothetical protein [Cytobacillus sp. AMY 15.2]MCM3090323.1 hypothetical protein [Cytobacillus sp. AMY 15.2]
MVTIIISFSFMIDIDALKKNSRTTYMRNKALLSPAYYIEEAYEGLLLFIAYNICSIRI